MTYSIDVNILLYASDKSNQRHQQAVSFLEQQLSTPELLCIAWITVMAFLRISTHPSIFANPLKPEEALQSITSLLSLPHVRTLSETDNFLEIYSTLSGKLPIRGNLVPDAHLAAILLQHDIRVLFTADTDFKKFDFLEALNPLD